jgi:DNA-binding winged helix-turn-helix (wHTH) protein
MQKLKFTMVKQYWLRSFQGGSASRRASQDRRTNSGAGTQRFQILVKLLQRPTEVVSREELRKTLWPADTFVDFEHGVNSAMARLRELLDDSAEGRLRFSLGGTIPVRRPANLISA